MKLYFAPRTASVRPRWLLEELEVPYELVRLDLSKGEHRTPAYLAVHPLGEVPALVDGDVTVLGSAASCLYLADRFPERKLAPPPSSPERGAYYQWLLFAEARLEPEVLPFLPPAQLSEEVLAGHRARLHAVLQAIDAALVGREYLVGTHFGAADVVMASILHLAYALKLLEAHPRLVEYAHRHAQRPAVRRAVSG